MLKDKIVKIANDFGLEAHATPKGVTIILLDAKVRVSTSGWIGRGKARRPGYLVRIQYYTPPKFTRDWTYPNPERLLKGLLSILELETKRIEGYREMARLRADFLRRNYSREELLSGLRPYIHRGEVNPRWTKKRLITFTLQREGYGRYLDY